jgi:electron transfer flavoprotein alpha subunit
MSNFIVLLKQVPDVSQITDSAFNPQTGTLMRNKLPSVINELDTRALAVAARMKQLANSGRIVCLTMGPPMAHEVLRYAIARGADDTMLLSDPALGGADTWATANPLSFAIRKIAREYFPEGSDYFVVSGMQSVDGDTAQVPAQIAAELRIPCIPYITAVEAVSGRFQFTTIVSGGRQVVSPRSVPCVLTVAAYDFPLFASFADTRKSMRANITKWGLADIKATSYGAEGSKTRVIRVFPPGKTNRLCRHVSDINELAVIMLKAAKDSDSIGTAVSSKSNEYVLPTKRTGILDRSFEGSEKEISEYRTLASALEKHEISDPSQITAETLSALQTALSGALSKKALEDMLAGFKHTETSYKGDIWVIAETAAGKIHTATLELTGKAHSLADSLGVRVGVVLAGSGIAASSRELIAAGADDVFVLEHKLLAKFDPAAYCKAVAHVIADHKPQVALFAATPQGRVLAPMVSYSLGCGLTADCTALDIRDQSRKGEIAILLQTRPALGGNVMATICTQKSSCQMATARPGVFKMPTPDANRAGNVINYPVELADSDLSIDIIKTELAAGTVDLAAAKIIVSGGKGLKNQQNYDELLSLLSDKLHNKTGLPVEHGASRAAVEQGFAQRIRQVGQTGTSVGPQLYVALGISGAIQHMIGIANTKTIVAVNSDPAAPIFCNCDYCYVGMIEHVIPQLVEALAKS